jgi:hypothetical protein
MYTTSLQNQLVQMGFTKQKAAEYIAQLGLTPKQIDTAITQSGMQESINYSIYYKKLLDDLNNRHITVSFQASGDTFMNEMGQLQHTGFATPGKAQGGLVSDGLTRINERGPEVLEKHGNSVRVHTAGSSIARGASPSGGGGGNVSLAMNLTVNADAATGPAIGQAVMAVVGPALDGFAAELTDERRTRGN